MNGTDVVALRNKIQQQHATEVAIANKKQSDQMMELQAMCKHSPEVHFIAGEAGYCKWCNKQMPGYGD